MPVQIKQNKIKIISYLLIILLIGTVLHITIPATQPTEQWKKALDNSRTDEAYAVATDSNDNILVTGFSEIANNKPCYTVKYSPTGSKLGHIQFSTSFSYSTCDVDCDSQNNIIIITSRTPSSSSNTDYYCAKYTTDGNFQWEYSYDETSSDIARAVAVDHQDNIIITGSINNNIYTIKLDPSGLPLWNCTYDSTFSDKAIDVTTDAYNNIIVAFQEKNGTTNNWKLVKYTPTGTELWNTSYYTAKSNSLEAITVDTENNILLTGTHWNGGNANILIQKYFPSGELIWEKIFHYSTGDYAAGIATNSFNDIFIAGSTYEALQRKNYLFVKYTKDGAYQWSQTIDRTSEDDEAQDVTVDTKNKIILTGWSKNVRLNADYYTIKYGADPIANFTYTPQHPTDLDTIQFTDTSMDPAGTITSHYWDFGDNQTSHIQHPTHQYTEDKIYNVTLQVTDDDGATNTVRKQIVVSNVPPTSDFIWESIDIPDNNTIRFIDQTIDLDGTIQTWNWDFDDGNTSTHPNPVHRFPRQGPFIVTLTTTDDDNDHDAEQKNIFVPDNKNPHINDTSPSSGTTGDSFTFSAFVTDNVAIQTVSVTYWYGSCAKHNVTLTSGANNTWSADILLDHTLTPLMYTMTATDTSLNSHTTNETSISIADNDDPTLLHDATPQSTTACQPLTFCIYASDNIALSTVTVDYWKQNTTHQFLSLQHQYGDLWENSIRMSCDNKSLFYKVTLQDYSGHSHQTAEQEIAITPNHPPNIPINIKPTPNQTDVSLNTTLKVNVSDPDNDRLSVSFYNGIDNSLIDTDYDISLEGIAAVLWPNRNEGTTYYWYAVVSDSVLQNTSAIWQFTTLRTSQPSMSTSSGGAGGGRPPVYNKKPIADASAGAPYEAVSGDPITFNASNSYDPDGVIIQYSWILSENITKTGKIIEHTFDTAGMHNITLIVEDDDGATTSLIVPVDISKPIHPPFITAISGETYGRRNTTYTFIINATDHDNDPLQFFIDWNDTTITQSAFFSAETLPYNISHNWTEIGVYTIAITASDTTNATSNTSYHSIYIDMRYLKNLGFLIDTDSDGTYDIFYSNNTNTTTPVQQQDNGYLIDTNGDGTYDTYYNEETQSVEAHNAGLEEIFCLFILIFLLILLFLLLIYALRKTQKQVRYKMNQVAATSFMIFHPAHLQEEKPPAPRPLRKPFLRRTISNQPASTPSKQIIARDYAAINKKIDQIINNNHVKTSDIDSKVDQVLKKNH